MSTSTPDSSTPVRARDMVHEALQSESHSAGHPISASDSKGQDFPGAFPRSSAEQGVSSGTEKRTPEGGYMEQALETAKGYLPESVQEYLPGGVTHKNQSEQASTTLPSQEIHGDTSGKSGGVGGLPGDYDESGVAILPEEKKKKKLSLGLGSAEAEELSAKHRDRAHQHSAVTAKDDKIRDLPPHEEGGSPVHTLPPAAVREKPVHAVGGATSVTAKKDDTLSPAIGHRDDTFATVDQKDQPFISRTPSDPSTTDKPFDSNKGFLATQPKYSKTNPFVSTGEKGLERGTAADFAAQDPPPPTGTTAPSASPTPRGGLGPEPAIFKTRQPEFDKQANQFVGVAATGALASVKKGDHHDLPSESAQKSDKFDKEQPSKEHSKKATEQQPSNRAVESTDKGDAAHTPSTQSQQSQTSSETSGETKKKAGFMDKLKGEVKVLTGKMSHDDKKIEEGKRMMGK